MHHIPLIAEGRRALPNIANRLSKEPEAYWQKRGAVQALGLFQNMAVRVPAYKDFLFKSGIKDPASIRTIEDLKEVPIISKDNYLTQYPLSDLCWDGALAENQWMVSSTSGSTGNPFYFPRSPLQDEQFALTAEQCLVTYFQIQKKSSLFINCFALGVWIGGMFVYQAIKYIIDSRKYPLSTITPGADKAEALKAIKNLASKFDQIIIGGYGPLVKDLIDEGITQGIDWSRYSMKYFFAAESFTEGFRDYLGENGGARDIYGGTLNIYGTADLGAMAHETPLSIVVRRLAAANPVLHERVFAHQHKLPTFAQYIPELYFFEEIDDRLVCSAPGGLPLVRYDLKDRGEVWGYDALLERLAEHGIDALEELLKRNISHEVWHLPFVSVYERNDLTVSIYSVNIYPESIKKPLEERRFRSLLTGKFTMLVDFDESQNQFLEINIELFPGAKPSQDLAEQVLGAIIKGLCEENSEWRDFYASESIRHKIVPRIAFWPYQDPKYFKVGGKQKWVKK